MFQLRPVFLSMPVEFNSEVLQIKAFDVKMHY